MKLKLTLALVAIFLLAYVSTGFYTIQYNEKGIVRRFGQQISEEISPGFHYHLPWPFEAVDRVALLYSSSKASSCRVTGKRAGSVTSAP